MKRFVLPVFFVLALTACSSKDIRPTDLGVKAGCLVPCPKKPNCVVSNPLDPKHYIYPIPYATDQEVAFGVLREVVTAMEGCTIIEETPLYFRLECLDGGGDVEADVELYFPNEPVIFIRSASRGGYWDFGANRKRLEWIRARFNEKIRDVKLPFLPEETGDGE
ncbi:DUF1499 domain-containing protein [Desulfatiferula olefinivorans]